jgi:hypothetical protein
MPTASAMICHRLLPNAEAVEPNAAPKDSTFSCIVYGYVICLEELSKDEKT